MNEGKIVRHTLQGEQFEEKDNYVKDQRPWERWRDEGKKKEEKWMKRRKRGNEVREAERGKEGQYKGWSWWEWCEERTKGNVDKAGTKGNERRKRKGREECKEGGIWEEREDGSFSF